MIRLAVAGLGQVTRHIHLPAYAKLTGRIEVVAGCDLDASARTTLHELRPAVPTFVDFTEMLEASTPDMVAICTPPFLHHQQCLEALSRGCHV